MRHTQDELRNKSDEKLQTVNYQHKWLVMSATGMGIFLSTIDTSIVNVALPTFVDYFDTNFPTVQWVVLSYLLTVTTLMLSIGRLADMLGKKRIYNGGFLVFISGSLLCGLSQSVEMLILSRVIQAIGAAMIMALGMAIVTEAFPPNERGRALGINGAIVSIGIIIGPSIGGLILDQVSWRWIFLVNLPVGLIGTLLVHKFVPNYKPVAGQIFDLPGAVTMFIGLLSFLLALTFGQRLGFTHFSVVALFIVFFLCLIVFIRIETSAVQPMIDLNIFRSRLLTINLVTGLMTFFSMGGITLLMPFYLQNVLGLPLREIGLLMIVNPVSMGAIAPISGRLSDRYGSRPIVVIGLGFLILGYIGLSTLSVDSTWLDYVIRYAPIGVGMGIFQSPNNSAVMGSAPRNRLGVVSSMLSVTRTLGQTMGVAVLGAIWSGNVFSHAGKTYADGATAAESLAQVLGLRDTIYIVIGLLATAFGLALYAFITDRKASSEATINP